MRKILLVTLLILTFVSLFTPASSTQQINSEQRNVGVEVGDWAKYDFVYNYITNDPAQPPPEIPDTDYQLVKVLSIKDTNITFQISYYFKNGTEMSLIAWTDVSTPYWNSFIAANLSVGDQLYIGKFLFGINATLMRTYAGAEREVNYIGLTYNSSVTTGLLVNGSFHFYWDRATGILDEMRQSQHFTNLTHGYTTDTFMQYVIKETNIWSPAHISAEVSITPKSLNLRSRGKWLTAIIKIPEEYDVKDINTTSIKLNETVEAEFKPRIAQDEWMETSLMVKFERQAVIDLITKRRQVNKFGTVTLTVTGSFKDGTQFQGSDSIKVIMPISKKAWRFWRYTTFKHFGSTLLNPNWNPNCDLNEDGRIDILDAVMLANNFGKEWKP